MWRTIRSARSVPVRRITGVASDSPIPVVGLWLQGSILTRKAPSKPQLAETETTSLKVAAALEILHGSHTISPITESRWSPIVINNYDMDPRRDRIARTGTGRVMVICYQELLSLIAENSLPETRVNALEIPPCPLRRKNSPRTSTYWTLINRQVKCVTGERTAELPRWQLDSSSPNCNAAADGFGFL